MLEAGEDPEILKSGGDFLGFTWSKKAKIALETISFWQNISIKILKFSPFLYTVKACQLNLINFKILKPFDKEREQTLIQQLMRKEK